MSHRPWLAEVKQHFGQPTAYQAPKLTTDKASGPHTVEKWLFKHPSGSTYTIRLIRYSDACWFVRVDGPGRKHVDYRQGSVPDSDSIRQALVLAGWLPAENESARILHDAIVIEQLSKEIARDGGSLAERQLVHKMAERVQRRRDLAGGIGRGAT